jgi:hypothetical protein
MPATLTNPSYQFGGPRAPTDRIGNSINDAVDEGFRLRNEEDRRYGASMQRRQAEFDRFNATDAITDDEINTRFGMAAEQTNRDANVAYGNARSALGDNGFFGSAGAALAGQIETARLGQLGGNARDLRLYKARLDTDKAMQRLQASSVLADAENESPSALWLDVLGGKASLEITREGNAMQLAAAKESAKAQKKAAKAGAAGGIVGSVIPFFGG